MAVSFDDLPIYGRDRALPSATALTAKLLSGLQRNHIPAIGFVTENQLDQKDRQGRIALLKRWLDAGMDLGNHGYSHLSLSHTPLKAYIADAARGDHVTRRLLAARGRQERWYRYPFLETGSTVESRDRFVAWLKQHDYRVAPVTMENSDWQFSDVYDDALDHRDYARARRVRAAYLDYTRRAVDWYQQASLALLGREIRFVLLLHASSLNADSMDAMAAILHHAHLKPVPLARAMEDPAYRIPETTVDADGDEWLTRWSQTLHRTLPDDSFPEVPPEIVAQDPDGG